MQELAAYTANPGEERLRELLAQLHAEPSVLVVLNHPVWDISHIGQDEHRVLLRTFLRRFGGFIHALELNGLRYWTENQDVVRLAEETRHPVISGGDRHGCEPGAALNLTNARSFEEFVAEVRHDRRSEVVFLPQYNEPLKLRFVICAWDVLRDYPNHPYGRVHWTSRVFVTGEDGADRPLAQVWRSGPPPWVEHSIRVVQLLASRRLRGAIRRAFAADWRVAQ
jgi:hypothetical protein